jgi:hypothetical protein
MFLQCINFVILDSVCLVLVPKLFTVHTFLCSSHFPVLVGIPEPSTLGPVCSFHFNDLTNSVVLVCERTIPTKRPPFVGEVSANFCGWRGVAWSVQRIPYGRNLGFLDRSSIVHSHKSLH